MTTPDMHTLTGAFAVDALSDVERTRFQRHVDECEPCAVEVAELRAAAARLGMVVAEEPPADLKPAVLAEVRGVRQLPPSAGRGPGERVRRSGRPSRWLMLVTAAAAVVGLALAGVFGGIALDTRHRLDATQDLAAQTRQVLAAPDVRVGHGAASVGGGGTVALSASLDRVVFVGARLPGTPGHDYEVWLLGASGPPRPAGILPHGDSPTVVVSGVEGARNLALTVEQPGGSPTGLPTTQPVLAMPIPT